MIVSIVFTLKVVVPLVLMQLANNIIYRITNTTTSISSCRKEYNNRQKLVGPKRDPLFCAANPANRALGLPFRDIFRFKELIINTIGTH